MPGFETPQPNDPPQPSGQGPFTWTHHEPEPAITGPAALQTARLGAWDALDPTTRARHLRALVVMSLQAATLRTEPQTLGALSAATFPDDEHNAAGAAVARTVMLIAPRGPAVVAQNMRTTGGEAPVMLAAGETGAVWVVIAVVAAVAVVGAAAYLIGRYTGETADRSDFRDAKTKQLLSTQATAVEVLAKHAEREKIAGKALPFTEEEKALLRSLEDAQRAISSERREPLPSPFEGAKSLADLGQSAAAFLDALLPIALLGGAFYLVARLGGSSEERGPPAPPAPSSPPAHPEAITLTRNQDGVYEYEEGHG